MKHCLGKIHDTALKIYSSLSPCSFIKKNCCQSKDGCDQQLPRLADGASDTSATQTQLE